MRKLWTFSLLGMFSLCITTVAEAKVCFLPNVLIGGKCVSLSKAKYNDCKGFTETINCETVGKAVIDTCTTEDGKTYYKCGCRGDVISWEVIKEHPGWLCEDGYDDGCGCSAEHIFCSSEYKYRGDGTGKCAKSDENDNSRGVGACALPNGRVYYKDCNCNGYPYECEGLTGLKAPTGVNEETVGCKSPHSSNYKYKECECADGWTSGSCESNTNGCLMPISYVTANDGELTCALCDERICKSNGESNLEAVYCAPKNENGRNTFGGEYLTSTITDCVDLGFVQGATGGFCPAGTQKAGEVGVKCPFNGNYMFCEDQTGCYPTKEACEDAESVKACQNIGGCYRVTECNEGYELNKDKTACVVAECAEGFTTEPLNCNDAEYGLMHGYNGEADQEGASGAKECKQCECDIAAARKEGYCKYTNNPADTENSIAAGEGILSVPCCDGSYSECRFDKGTTTPSEGTATHEIHEACGQKYYVATSCLEGYGEPVNGRCESKSCATGYTTTVQSVNDCEDSSKFYKGAMGWSIKAQEANGKVVQSGGKTCYQCLCDASDCKWVSTPPDPNSDLKYKGRFGLLPEETACCDGSNKSCVVNRCRGVGTDDLTDDNDPTNDCIPDSASIALCNAMPEHAVSMKKYEACSQKARCLVRECEQGYRPSDDGKKCVEFSSCSDMGYTTDAHAGNDAWKCRETTLTDKNGQHCYKCECPDGYAMNSSGVCEKNCDNGLLKVCPVGYACRLVDGCYEKTGECATGYYKSGLNCKQDYCGRYGYYDNCSEEQEDLGLLSVNGMSCHICQDNTICNPEKDRFYNNYMCNIKTGTDCGLKSGDFCYVPGEKCFSLTRDSGTAELSTPCDGIYHFSYEQKCGLFWTGGCYDRFDENLLSSHVYVRPQIEKIKTIINEKESKYITMDDVAIDVTIMGEDIDGNSKKIGSGTVGLYGTVLKLDNLLKDIPYYYVRVDNMRALVSEHSFKDMMVASDSAEALDKYQKLAADTDSSLALVDDKIFIGNKFIRRGVLELTPAVLKKFECGVFTGGKCELTRRDNPGALSKCEVIYDGTVSYDGTNATFVGGPIDYTSRVPYLQSYCGDCLNKLGYKIGSYDTCGKGLGPKSICVAAEGSRWIHIIPSSNKGYDGNPESLEENMAYIFIIRNDLPSEFYDEYRHEVKWKE